MMTTSTAHSTYEAYLGVSPEGIVQTDTRKQANIPGLETWRCEYLGDHFKVQRLYPDPDSAKLIIKIDAALQRSVESKFNEYALTSRFRARHESGHAVVSYALCFRPVQCIDLRLGVLPGRNLIAQIQTGRAENMRFIGGTASIAWRQEDSSGLHTKDYLASACQGLGGVAACPEFEKGKEADLSRVMQICSALAKLVPMPIEKQRLTALSLGERLRALADEIFRNAVIAARHNELSEQLSKEMNLDQQAIEAILDVPTLPDYSDRLVKIQSEFKLPERSDLH
jgi:hypothetical protein